MADKKNWTWEQTISAVQMGKAKDVPAALREDVAATRLGVLVGAIEYDEGRLTGESDAGRRDKIQMALDKRREERSFFTDMLTTARAELAGVPQLAQTPVAAPAAPPSVQAPIAAAGSETTMTRPAFEKLSSREQANFCKRGGKLLEPPSVAASSETVNPLVMNYQDWRALSAFEKGQFQTRGGKVVHETMNRSAFEKLSSREQADFCKKGGRLTD